jgi:hypothetical protein
MLRYLPKLPTAQMANSIKKTVRVVMYLENLSARMGIARRATVSDAANMVTSDAAAVGATPHFEQMTERKH